MGDCARPDHARRCHHNLVSGRLKRKRKGKRLADDGIDIGHLPFDKAVCLDLDCKGAAYAQACCREAAIVPRCHGRNRTRWHMGNRDFSTCDWRSRCCDGSTHCGGGFLRIGNNRNNQRRHSYACKKLIPHVTNPLSRTNRPRLVTSSPIRAHILRGHDSRVRLPIAIRFPAVRCKKATVC